MATASPTSLPVMAANLRFFINQGNGFKPPVAIAESCSSLSIGDFNGDGLADVAAANGTSAQVLMNISH